MDKATVLLAAALFIARFIPRELVRLHSMTSLKHFGKLRHYPRNNTDRKDLQT
jgi:hypothetical protein